MKFRQLHNQALKFSKNHVKNQIGRLADIISISVSRPDYLNTFEFLDKVAGNLKSALKEASLIN